MKAFEKLQVSRQPFNPGDKDIDGYFFKLKENLSGPEQQELFDHAMESSKHVFTQGRAFGSSDVRFNDNNPNEKVKTMFLLTTLKTEAGSPAFTIDKIYGISKIKAMVAAESIYIPKRVKKEEPKVDKKEETPPAVAAATGEGTLGSEAAPKTETDIKADELSEKAAEEIAEETTKAKETKLTTAPKKNAATKKGAATKNTTEKKK